MRARLSALILLLSPLMPACKGTDASPALMGTSELTALDYHGIRPLTVQDGILLAGQPSEEALRHAAEDGLRTVIDIRHSHEERGFDEPALLEELGMTYVLHEVGSPDDLTPEFFDEMRRLLRESPKPVMLHCASSNRVGAVWLAYQATDGGMTIHEAKAEAEKSGLRSSALAERALEYVRRDG